MFYTHTYTHKSIKEKKPNSFHSLNYFSDKREINGIGLFQKHGTTSKPLKPVRLDSEEQAKIAKAGLEMKLITSEMDAETEKWQESGSALEENNDIVKRAKNMSSMAFSMYQFTRGEGALKTTQDLFTQAEYFAEEANRLYKVVRQFSYQVRSGWLTCRSRSKER